MRCSATDQYRRFRNTALQRLALLALLSLQLPAVQAYPIYADGDLAPYGAPDGIVDSADLLLATRIAVGELAAGELELGHGDIYPPGAPDGVVNAQDLVLLQRWVLGDVAIDGYREILDIYNDGPATVSAEAGGSSGDTTLVTGGYTAPGATVINDSGASDPVDAGNTAWYFSVSGGTANIFIGTDDLEDDPVLDSGFDISGGGNAMLVFDLYVVNISGGASITVKMDSGYPDLGQYTLTPSDYSVGSWRRISIDLDTLLANPGPGDGLNVNDVINAFVLEVTGGSAELYVDDIFFIHGCDQPDDCHATVNTKPVYQLIWSDEFDGDALDSGNWSYDTGYGGSFGWGNDEWQNYTTSTSNVDVSGGLLEIRAQCANPPNCGKRNGTITSGRIKTLNKFSFKYGRIEARIKVPVGKAAWPAFWMLGANHPDIGWPNSGEIDIMEIFDAFSDEFTTHATVHWCDDYVSSPCQYDPGWDYNGSSLSLGSSLGDDFHVYSAEWDEDSIRFRIDGMDVYIHLIDPGNMAEFREEFFMLLNVAMGGTVAGSPDAGTSWPQVMQVDYVRVYQQVDGNGTYSIPGQIPPAANAGIYSETHTDPVVPWTQIINSAVWLGNSTLSDTSSSAVSPADGSNVLAVDFQNSGKAYGGFIFDLGQPTDITGFTTLKFALDASAMPALDNLVVQIENPGGGQPAPKVQLENYTPVINGNWAEYEIPLADFLGQAVSLDLGTVLYIGFWNPQNSSNQLLFGDLYFDDIHLSGGTP